MPRRLRRGKSLDGGLWVTAAVSLSSSLLAAALVYVLSKFESFDGIALAVALVFGCISICLVLISHVRIVNQSQDLGDTVTSSVEQLSRDLGSVAEYVSLDNVSDGQSGLYRKAVGFIESAEQRIIVVNSPFSEEHERGGATRPARDSYFDHIVNKAVPGSGFTYRRVFQIPSAKKTLTIADVKSKYTAPQTFDHLANIGKLIEQGVQGVSVHLSKAAYPGTFVIIDNDKIMFQIDEYHDYKIRKAREVDYSTVSRKGILMITDRTGQVVDEFAKKALGLISRGVEIQEGDLVDLELFAEELRGRSP
ncbi:MAG: hypothetical protein AAGA55_01245 [Planctomycetota bacterium]